MRLRIIDEILNECRGESLKSIYKAFKKYFGSPQNDSSINDYFIYFLYTLLRDNELKLARNGKFLDGSLKYKISIIRQDFFVAYDNSNVGLVYNNLGNIIEDPKNDEWWDTQSGFQAVWIMEDGSLKWT
ncbi:hypothetical protein SAMN05660772_02837 [Pasteurella testudinis DSM 23072]|uniref:Uncharacterized protein n=1 Tax=Pasteurella testudinis DSM 23072 TaxID=1122938 RepID=A0A1W1V587_9PAST|nr:DUF596 domain-containing protein [Pasteurella testudinis]SMB88597.1 hypothetical protein SAMN05660772_02837 [Pasteurella testudinis DSM 23072]SUB50425.1 Uncharacterized protein conserved in bacteria [Pasteurella testudinis]